MKVLLHTMINEGVKVSLKARAEQEGRSMGSIVDDLVMNYLPSDGPMVEESASDGSLFIGWDEVFRS